MPKLSDFLTGLQFITYEAALLGLFITAGFIIISRDWRTLIMALLVQYILVGLILARIVRPDIAILKIMIGAFICPGLFLSARQVSVSVLALTSPGRVPGNHFMVWWQNVSITNLLDHYRDTTSTGFSFRLILILLVIMVAMILGENFPLQELAPNVTIAIYWLILAGLTTLMLTEDPIQAGHGLLTVFIGFDLYYSTLEQSFLMTGLWGIINLLTALAIGYLIIARGATPEEDT
jgi:hypothetical protein